MRVLASLSAFNWEFMGFLRLLSPVGDVDDDVILECVIVTVAAIRGMGLETR